MTGTGQQLYRQARRRIPGGTQLLSKRPEMFLPEQWPSYFRRAKGVEVWDLDGKRYTDMTHNGIGACVLGAADPDVDQAVREAIERGVMSTLNCPEEPELAEVLCGLHPWAEMVRYTRTGGEAAAVAVRIARASTRRDRVAFCGYHGWHDWYLAANLGSRGALDGHLLAGLEPAGVPRALAGTALPFRYNHLEELSAIVEAYGPELAAVIMEPIRNEQPQPGFLEGVRGLSRKAGAVLIFDEITAGFRLLPGGSHLRYGVAPDMAVLGKAMSNGYAMAAVIGIRGVMQAAETSFISSTYWTERIGPAAALATIAKLIRCDVASWLQEAGARVQRGWLEAARAAGLAIEVGGIAPLSHFALGGELGPAAQTLFAQWMLERGFLAGKTFYPTWAHQPSHLEAYLEAAGEVFAQIGSRVKDGSLMECLHGPVAHTSFQRLN